MEISIKAEDLRKVKLFVATPMYGGQCFGLYTKACLDLQAYSIKYGFQVHFSFQFNESLITRARNYMVDQFLKTDSTHLLFIDSDILFDPQDVLALLALDKDIIGGPYPKKSINWRAVWQASKNLLGHPDFDETKFDPGELANVAGEYVFNPIPGTEKFTTKEPLEVLEIGTGYMLIKRAVFAKYAEEYPHLKYIPDHDLQHREPIYAFFDTVIDPDTRRYLSEDYMFCQNWRAIGGKIWLCPWMKTTHVGTYPFAGDLDKISQLVGTL